MIKKDFNGSDILIIEFHAVCIVSRGTYLDQEKKWSLKFISTKNIRRGNKITKMYHVVV